jgi:protein-L-isoaspartate(D-aspartate) O-methyltransferase
MHRSLSFSDLEIPLRKGASACERMWFPKFEARVLQELALRKSDRVLDIGTGSGYFAALMSHRAQQVHSVEIEPELASRAQAALAEAGVGNVTVEIGDASRGWKTHEPYDVVVVGSSLPVVPEEILAQIRPGGRLFAVVGDPPVMTARVITVQAGARFSRDLFETSLAPLVNAVQPERFRF